MRSFFLKSSFGKGLFNKIADYSRMESHIIQRKEYFLANPTNHLGCKRVSSATKTGLGTVHNIHMNHTKSHSCSHWGYEKDHFTFKK